MGKINPSSKEGPIEPWTKNPVCIKEDLRWTWRNFGKMVNPPCIQALWGDSQNYISSVFFCTQMNLHTKIFHQSSKKNWSCKKRSGIIRWPNLGGSNNANMWRFWWMSPCLVSGGNRMTPVLLSLGFVAFGIKCHLAIEDLQTYKFLFFETNMKLPSISLHVLFCCLFIWKGLFRLRWFSWTNSELWCFFSEM